MGSWLSRLTTPILPFTHVGVVSMIDYIASTLLVQCGILECLWVHATPAFRRGKECGLVAAPERLLSPFVGTFDTGIVLYDRLRTIMECMRRTTLVGAFCPGPATNKRYNP